MYRPEGFSIEPAVLAGSIARVDGRVRIVVAEPGAEEIVRRVRRERPDVTFEVVRM